MTSNIKRWMITAIIMAVILVGTINTSSAHAVSGITQPNYWGNKIGSFTYNGVEVPAYSNGNKGIAYDSHSYSPYGLQYHCTEYVNRFYALALGKTNMPKGNGKTYLENGPSYGLVKNYNGKSKTAPQMGDVICSNLGLYGHVAIVRQVLPDSIRVIHQNWKYLPGPPDNNYYNQDCNYYKLSMKRNADGSYYIYPFSSSYPVSGWLHKP